MRHFFMLLLALSLGLSASAQTCTVQVDPAPCGGSLVLFSVPQRVTLEAGDGRQIPLADAVDAAHRLAVYAARQAGQPAPSRSQAVAELVSRALVHQYMSALRLAQQKKAEKLAAQDATATINEELGSP